MSKTPETDAEVSGVRPWVIDDNRLASWTDYECLRDFARRMERERNTALAALEALVKLSESCCRECEYDEAEGGLVSHCDKCCRRITSELFALTHPAPRKG